MNNILLIQHRVNSIEFLKTTPVTCGVEIDLRSQAGELILQHDPFKPGELFREWLLHYRHRFIILNVKEDGLEPYILTLLQQFNIDQFFFLDQSFPSLIHTLKRGESRASIRVSEFESISTALALAGRVQWVWVDAFTRFPLTRSTSQQLVDAGYKLCLVSPELLGRHEDIEISELQLYLHEAQIDFHAVCTKKIEQWSNMLKQTANGE